LPFLPLFTFNYKIAHMNFGLKDGSPLLKYIIVSLLLLFTSCEREKPSVIAELSLNEKFSFNEAEYRSYLESSFTTPLYKLTYDDTLNLFYENRNYHPVFIKSFESEEFLYPFLSLIYEAGEHGFDPEDYYFTLIKEEYLKAVDTLSRLSNRYIHLANIEQLVSNAVVKYSWHLRYGVVNPSEIFPDSYFLPLPDSASRDLFQPLRRDDILDYLNEIQPKSKKYVRLQAALKEFSKLKDTEWTPIFFSKRKLEAGSHDASVPLILERLVSLNLLDTSQYKITDAELYDTTIANAVKEFQRIHGLRDDGVIGSSTLDKLNYTPLDYINKIKLSLERFRWVDYAETPRYIMVNIPDFNLYIYEDQEIKFSSRVCTGLRRAPGYDAQYAVYKKTRNWRSKPEDWETPAMYGEISYMVLNPTWTVPVSIIREEIAREVKKDTSYLERKNFRIFRDGNEIAAASVRPQELISGTSSFRIVQGPGSQNALGKIKFMFNNPFGIYLHDTPSRAPFNLDNRAVSHGCVRVEKPLGLSEYLLNHQSKWNIDFLKLEVGAKVDDPVVAVQYREKRSELRRNNSYGVTTDVKLDKKIPLYIDYYTAWVDDEGRVNFREDVYRKDKKLLEILLVNLP
jgi:L,D-transpeptidase YcbB